jgi:hypothetical protein
VYGSFVDAIALAKRMEKIRKEREGKRSKEEVEMLERLWKMPARKGGTDADD